MRLRLFLLCISLCFSVCAAGDEKAGNPTLIIHSITDKLKHFSGRSYPVFVRPNPGWGEARADGSIVIDVKIAQKQPKEVVAYLLARKWIKGLGFSWTCSDRRFFLLGCAMLGPAGLFASIACLLVDKCASDNRPARW